MREVIFNLLNELSVFNAGEIEKLKDQINGFFDYYEDDEYCFNTIKSVIGGLINTKASFKDDFMRAIFNCYSKAYKKEYMDKVVSLNIAKECTENELKPYVKNYFEGIKNIAAGTKNALKDIKSTKLEHGIVTYEGYFFPFSSESGFYSHEELEKSIIKSGATNSPYFLEVGLKEANINNHFPIVRLAANNAGEIGSKIDISKPVKINDKLARSLYNIFLSNNNGKGLFEKFLIENVMGLSFASNPLQPHKKDNLETLDREFSAREFDREFYEEQRYSGKYKPADIKVSKIPLKGGENKEV